MERLSPSSHFGSGWVRFRPAYLLLLLGFSTYLFFSLAHLSLPGLQYDEVLFTNAALGDVDGTFVEWKIRVLGKNIPLMLMKYIGALKAFIYAPIFYFIGRSAAAVRLPVIVLGVITLVFIYALVRRMLDERPALLTLVLVAADPSFIFSVKLDWGPVALMMVLKAASLYLVVRWLESGEMRFLAASSFLLGLGVYDKIVFIWYVVALAAGLLICYWREVKNRIRWSTLSISAAAFVIGCLPLIAHNITHSLQIFQGHGLRFVRVGESLAYRYHLFYSTFEGSAVYYFVNHMDIGDVTALFRQEAHLGLDAFIAKIAGFPLRSTILPQMLILALIVLLLLRLSKRLAHAQAVSFFLIQVVVVAVFVYLSDEATGPHHTIMVYPFPHILIGSALDGLMRLGEGQGKVRGRLFRLSSCLGLMALLVSEVIIDARYVRSFQVKGGVGNWSDAIYDLAQYANNQPDKYLMLMDWGFSNQLLLLSQTRLRKEESFVYFSDIADEEKLVRLRPYLAQQNSILIFHAPSFETHPLVELFIRSLERDGLKPKPLKVFYQRDGRPLYMLFETPLTQSDSFIGRNSHIFFREAEDTDIRRGGDIDLKKGASRGKALGGFWGRAMSDFAVYRFSLPSQVADAHFYLRYAFEWASSQSYNLFLDDNLIGLIILPTTGGVGYTEREWKVFGLAIGTLAGGTHELKIAPASSGQVVNLDYFYISEGEFRLDTPPALR